MWLFTSDQANSLFWSRFLMAGAILIPSVYLHFTEVFLYQSVRHSVLVRLGYLFSFVYLGLNFTPLFIADVEPRQWFRWWPVPGITYHLYQIYFIAVVLYTHFLLFRKAVTAGSDLLKKQYLFVALGTAVAYGGGSTNFFLWYNIPVPPVFNFLVSGYVIFIAYAIVKYRLMDISIVLTKTMIFVLLYALIIGFPVGLAAWGRSWLQAQTGEQWWALPLALYSVLTLVGPFLYLMLQNKAEAYLLREQRRYQQTLLQASQGMTLIKDLKYLLNLTVHVLTRTLRISHAAIYLCEAEKNNYVRKAARAHGLNVAEAEFSRESVLIQRIFKARKPLVTEEIRFRGTDEFGGSAHEVIQVLEGMQAAAIIPSFVHDELLGFLVLGAKKDKHLYTQDDIATLSTLANQSALAIENCRFIAEVERTQAQLFQTAKMMDIGAMASGIGHQINNRFNVITVGADMARMIMIPGVEKAYEGRDDAGFQKNLEEIRKNFEKMKTNAVHGREIVVRLLDFSRLSEGFEPVDIAVATEHSVGLWRLKHQDLDKINFENTVPLNLRPVLGNLAQVEDIIFNLLDNAHDALILKEEAWCLGRLPRPEYEEQWRVSITASEVHRDALHAIEIQVSDNGLGMTEETQRRIFAPFFTTKATTIKGTGLGLYIIQRMIHAHKGKIMMESTYGIGTTFRVLLPVAEKCLSEAA